MEETPVTPALRASDAEREEVARTLRAHLAAGTCRRPAGSAAVACSGAAAASLVGGEPAFKTRIRSSKGVAAVRDDAMRTVVPELVADGYRLSLQSPTSLILERTYRPPAWTFFVAVIVFPVGLVALLHTDSAQVVIHLEPLGNGSLCR